MRDRALFLAAVQRIMIRLQLCMSLDNGSGT
jgi:hypothetical protein